jgi:hypothetical protein
MKSHILTRLHSIKRKAQFFPVWICLKCSETNPREPKIYVQGINLKKLTKNEVEELKKKGRQILEFPHSNAMWTFLSSPHYFIFDEKSHTEEKARALESTTFTFKL